MTRRVWVALALMAPAAIPYVAHVAEWKPRSLPTGYIQADMPVYMAKAREAFDAGAFGFLYANPSGGSATGPRIYFQPWTFALGLVHFVTRLPPGVLWVLFAFLAAWAAARATISVFDQFVGLRSRSSWLALVAFAWGGGLLAAGGALTSLASGGALSWDALFAHDPARGWWFLNLGRNFVYPTESLYHALAFLAIVQAARRRTIRTLLLAAATAACSPFAGLQLLAILGLYSLSELLFGEDRAWSARLLAGWSLVLAAFLAYYAVVLNRFPEHRALVAAMSLDWRYSGRTFLLAYGPVLAMAGWNLRSAERLRRVATSAPGRLLLSWGASALILENHDFFTTPRQPLHFTRGYAWSAFFLLGAPALVSWLDRLPRWGRLALMAAVLSDNLAWFAGIVREVGVADHNGLRLTSESRALLDRLDGDDLRDALLICEDERLSYLAIAETRLRSWVGHHLETPGYADRVREVEAFFKDGRLAHQWAGRRLVIVKERRGDKPVRIDWLRDLGGEPPIWQNRRFQILEIRMMKSDVSIGGADRAVP